METGQDSLVLTIECTLSNNLPDIVIVGYANKAVDEAKERIRSGFNLAIANAILQATGQIRDSLTTTAIMGELGLEGDVRPICGIIGKILVSKKHGIGRFIIPAGNLAQAALIPGVRIVPITNLGELYNDLSEPTATRLVDTDLHALRPRKQEALRTIV